MPNLAAPHHLAGTAPMSPAGAECTGSVKALVAPSATVRLASARQLALSGRQLAQVAVATLLVAGCPVAAVWWLRAAGIVSSAALGVVIGMALSISASYLGCLVWERRLDSEDLLFSELMVWGYLHRWRTQRRLASALDMVRPMSQAQRKHLDGLTTREQAKLLEQLVWGVETRDPYLHGHSRRVARYAWMIARKMGLSRAEVARIRTAAAVHDVGKIRTPTAILHKPSALTDEEYEVIKSHPGDGAAMADILRDPGLTSMVRHHHERLDGTGYPDRISGEEIPLGARIIAVADTFDAITSGRPYRPASAHRKAIQILREEAGTRLDPDVVRAFCGHYAGRAPIALSSVVSSAPERVAAWLGSSVGSVASAAKVAAVAALVGSVAATSATFGLQGANDRPFLARRQPLREPAQVAGAPVAAAGISSAPARAARTRLSDRRAVLTPAIHHRGPGGRHAMSVASRDSATVGVGANRGAAPGAAEMAGKAENAADNSAVTSGAGGSEGSAKVTGETSGKAKAEIPSTGASGKSETPSSGTTTEILAKAETPSTGTITESPTKVTTTETPGKTAETPAKTEGVIEKVVGVVKELPKL